MPERKWIASDGSAHDTRSDAERHEATAACQAWLKDKIEAYCHGEVGSVDQPLCSGIAESIVAEMCTGTEFRDLIRPLVFPRRRKSAPAATTKRTPRKARTAAQ